MKTHKLLIILLDTSAFTKSYQCNAAYCIMAHCLCKPTCLNNKEISLSYNWLQICINEFKLRSSQPQLLLTIPGQRFCFGALVVCACLKCLKKQFVLYVYLMSVKHMYVKKIEKNRWFACFIDLRSVKASFVTIYMEKNFSFCYSVVLCYYLLLQVYCLLFDVMG